MRLRILRRSRRLRNIQSMHRRWDCGPIDHSSSDVVRTLTHVCVPKRCVALTSFCLLETQVHQAQPSAMQGSSATTMIMKMNSA
eukprot:COSAG02_NODE_23_length_52893_cov_58.101868_21_plen_84_part_00